MMRPALDRRSLLRAGLAAMLALLPLATAGAAPRVDWLSLARGAVPVELGGASQSLGLGMSQALAAIDEAPQGFVLTLKPGPADTSFVIVVELPAATTFDSFAIPNVLETPSPSQTFVKDVVIAGSAAGRDGPFDELARVTLATHPSKGEATEFAAAVRKPVRWLRLTLAGGIRVERDKTFLEFSEIAGYGTQEPVPMSTAFSGKWQARGVKLALQQDGVRVSGCYDDDGELQGTVGGPLLLATGKSRKSGVPSAFVLSVDSRGAIFGVRSTNGAPFKLYGGDSASALKMACAGQAVAPLGCGAVVHGIQFDFDSAAIRPASKPHLDALHDGLRDAPATSITVVGHTSSEGAQAYNDELSQRRAEAVVAALRERGIAAGRLAAQGRGEQQPIADNATEAGRALNRRVEIACR